MEEGGVIYLDVKTGFHEILFFMTCWVISLAGNVRCNAPEPVVKVWIQQRKHSVKKV